MKIGIITLYYKNNNYGGLLQSYALCRFLNKSDRTIFAEQICANAFHCKTIKNRIRDKIKDTKRLLLYPYNKIKELSKKILTCKINEGLKSRNIVFSEFAKKIPHTDVEYIYGSEYEGRSIVDVIKEYDLFIVGSDQVWNYWFFNPIFYLDGVDVKKISYAASIGHSELPVEWKEKYQKLLSGFFAISVREKDAVDLLQPISPVEVEWVLDPTLLLSVEEWDDICAPRVIEDRYIFCYFLGGNERDRRVAEEVANEKGLKIITLPHLLGEYREVDADFGDKQLWGVSPEKFISLIKYADFVLTDSFHGSVFSLLYQTPFAVFERKNASGMGGGLKSLTELTNTEDRFLNSNKKTTAEYICSLKSKVSADTDQMRIMREKSYEYLKRNIDLVMKTKKMKYEK